MSEVTPKTIDKAAIESAAESAGMTTSEFLEWGLYCIFATFDGTNNSPADAMEALKHVRTIEGALPDETIPSNPLAEFASNASISFAELNELALLSAINIMNTTDFRDKQPRGMLEDARQQKGSLLPSFSKEKPAVHPFMARLFSGDLKAVHGPTFGELGSADVGSEHHFMSTNLERIFAMTDWEDSFCHLMDLETVIRHCPVLKNEAAAIRTLIEAEQHLIRFNNAVNAA